MNEEYRIEIAKKLGWKKDYPACDERTEEDILAWRSPDGRGPLGDGYLPNPMKNVNEAILLVPEKTEIVRVADNLWMVRFTPFHGWHYGTTLAKAICFAWMNSR